MRRRILIVCADLEMRRHMRTTLQEIHDLVLAKTMTDMDKGTAVGRFDAILLHIEPLTNWDAQEQWLETLRQMCQHAKGTPVIGYVGHFTASASRQLFEAMGRGMHKLATREFADLLMTTNQALGIHIPLTEENASAEAERIFQQVFEPLPSLAGRIVRCCARYSGGSLSVTELARHLSISRRYMEATLASAGLPSPEPLISWCRLVHAAVFLQNKKYTIEAVAKQLAFANVSTLRSLVGRYLQVRPSVLRQPNALSIISKALEGRYIDPQHVAA